MNTESNLYIYKYIDKHKALYNFVYHVVLNCDREIIQTELPLTFHKQNFLTISKWYFALYALYPIITQ